MATEFTGDASVRADAAANRLQRALEPTPEERFKSLGEFVSAALKAQNGGPVDPRLQPAEPEPQGFTEGELRQMQGIADQLDEESK